MPIFNKAKSFTEASYPAPAKVAKRRAASDFKVPSPSDLVPDLAKLDRRSTEINAAIRLDRAEIKILEAEIASDDTTELHPAVAALIDGEVSPKGKKRARIKELRHSLAVSSAALDEIAKRRLGLDNEANRAVSAAVRPEAERLLGKLVKALEAVDAAHQELGDLLVAVEVEGVSVGHLGSIRPYFLGDHREGGRRIPTYIKEIKDAGYAI